MTDNTTGAAGYESDEVRVSVTSRLAHIAPTAYMAVAALAGILTFIPPDNALALIAGLTIVSVDIILVISCFRHAKVLCITCATMTPEDGNAAAERFNRDLRRYHTGSDAIWLVPLLAIVLGGLLTEFPEWVTPLALWASYVGTSLKMRAWNQHALLAPWCLYCRGGWGRGGDHERAPDPVTPDSVKP